MEPLRHKESSPANSAHVPASYVDFPERRVQHGARRRHVGRVLLDRAETDDDQRDDRAEILLRGHERGRGRTDAGHTGTGRAPERPDDVARGAQRVSRPVLICWEQGIEGDPLRLSGAPG